MNLSDYGKAIEYAYRATRIKNQIGDRVGEAKGYGNIAMFYHYLKDYNNAIEYYKKVIRIAGDKTKGDKKTVLYCYVNISYAYIESSKNPLDYLSKVKKLAEEIDDRAAMARYWSLLGKYTSRKGCNKKAIKYGKQANIIAKEIKDNGAIARNYAALGIYHIRLNKYRIGIDYLKRAEKIAKKVHDKVIVALSNGYIGIVYYSVKKYGLSYRFLQKSIDIYEAISSKLIDNEFKMKYNTASTNLYQTIVNTCVHLQKPDKAYEYVRRSKSKALMDLLSTGNIRPRVSHEQHEIGELIEKEQALLKKRRVIQTKFLGNDTQLIDNRDALISDDVDHINNELEQIYQKIESVDPEYVFLRKVKIISLDEIKKLLSHKEDMMLVEYYVTDNKIFIFITNENELYLKTATLSNSQSKDCLSSFEQEVINYHDNFGQRPFNNLWLNFGRFLIEPLSEFLNKGKLIYFIPHDFIHQLPLHAFNLDNEPLIKKHSVVYLPNSSMLSLYNNKKPLNLNTISIFGIEFQDEAKEIGKIYNTEPNLNVSKEDLTKDLGSDLIHIPSHAGFNEEDPLSSCIVLRNGELLTARELFDMEINSNLITLSSCETGRAKLIRGDELIGLTRSLLYQGAQSLIVSLWKV